MLVCIKVCFFFFLVKFEMMHIDDRLEFGTTGLDIWDLVYICLISSLSKGRVYALSLF